MNQIFKPLIKKYDLKSYGFALRQITHPTMIDIGRPKAEKFWQGGWIFADTTSTLWPKIQKVLLPIVQMNVTRPNHDAYQDMVGKVLGYPVPRFPRNYDCNIVRYMDETERQILTKLFHKDECQVEVVGLEYWDDNGNTETWKTCTSRFLLVYPLWSLSGAFQFRKPFLCKLTLVFCISVNNRRADFQHLGMYHFGSCAEAMQSLGGEIKINLRGHPPFEKFWNDIKSHAAKSS